jgi:hypothetical protein
VSSRACRGSIVVALEGVLNRKEHFQQVAGYESRKATPVEPLGEACSGMGSWEQHPATCLADS